MGIFLINPYVFSKIVREYFGGGYEEARTTNATTTFNAVTTVNTTEPAAADYVAFWQARLDHSAINSDARADLFETSARQLVNYEPQDLLDKISVGGAYYYAGGTNKTFQIRFSAEAGTSGIHGYGLTVLKLATGDVGNVNIANASTTSTTFQNRLTITFPEAGDYYVFGSCELLTDNADARLNINGTAAGTIVDAFGQDATNFTTYWHIEKFTATAGQTAALEYRSNDGTTMSIRGASLIALKKDGFDNAFDYSLDAEQTTTSTTFVTAAQTGTFSLPNPQNYHLLFGSAFLSHSSTTTQASAELIDLNRDRAYMLAHTREANDAAEEYPTVVARLVTFPYSSVELAWRLRASAGTAALKNIRVVLLDTGVLGPTTSYLGSRTAQNSSTIDLPPNLQENDIVIVASFGLAITPALPTGYTAGQSGQTAAGVGYRWSYKFMGATPDTTADGLSTGTGVAHMAIAFRNINTTTPLDVTTPVVTTAATGMPNPPSITTSTANTTLVAIGYIRDDAVKYDVLAPIDFELCEAEETSGATGTIMMAFRNLTAAATVDPTAFGNVGGLGTDDNVGVTLALRRDR